MTRPPASTTEKAFFTWSALKDYRAADADFNDVFAEWEARGIEDKGFDFDLKALLTAGGVTCTVCWTDRYIAHMAVTDDETGATIYSYVRGIPR